jgi:hypothetical protein
MNITQRIRLLAATGLIATSRATAAAPVPERICGPICVDSCVIAQNECEDMGCEVRSCEPAPAGYCPFNLLLANCGA